MKMEEYLDVMEEQIRCKQARMGVRAELKGHMEDQMDAYLLQGMTPEEAEAAAVMDMGDPVETGNDLDRIHRPKMPWKSIGIIIGFSLVAFILQYVLRISEPSQEGMLSEWIPGGDLRYLIINMVGWGIMVGICYLDYTRIGKYADWLMVLGIIGMMMSGHVANQVNGHHYFIWFFGISISLDMLSFLFVPLYGAILYRYRGQGYRAIAWGILWMLPSVCLVMSRGRMLLAFTVGITYMVILTAAICKSWFVISKKITLGILWAANLILPLLWGIYIMSQGASYQKNRLQVLLNPYGTEAGYQVVMLKKLLAGSRMVGTKPGFLQDAHGVVETGNYILSMICAYYGVLIAVILAAGIVMLFCRFFQKSLRQKNQMGMIMGIGVSAVFLVELLLYIPGNMGWVLGDAYCPFLGYGGSGIMVTYILLGILLSVYRYENVASEMKMEKRIRIQVIKS